MSKILTVFGATGVQGGSVIKAVLAHPTLSKTYKIRAVTRDPSKPNAQALAAQGIEPVKADMDDTSSIQAAIHGSYAVFAVTNYWEKMSKDIEVAQGKAIANTSKKAGVKHLIWSALPHVTRMTDGKLAHVEHFDSKAEVAEYIESIKGDNMISSYMMPGFYMSNIRGMTRAQDGVPIFSQPWDANSTHVPLFDAADDTGKFVTAILAADPTSVNGRYVQAVSEWRTPLQIVDDMSQVIGREVKFAEVPASVFESFLPAAVAKELTENMMLVREYSYYGVGKEKEQDKENELLGDMKTTTWKEFVEKNGPWEW